MVKVKICGVTREEDGALAVELGAAFIGLNFWPGSSRYLTLDRARRIAEAVGDGARVVGLWVDPDRSEVAAVDDEIGLDLFQFHGSVASSVIDRFGARTILALDPAAALGAARESLDERVWGYLVDCAAPGVYGGSGQPWPYERIARLETEKPVLLAGGLSPDNVAAAVERSRVGYVDVCSGVEEAPGIKSPELLHSFFEEVRNAQTQD